MRAAGSRAPRMRGGGPSRLVVYGTCSSVSETPPVRRLSVAAIAGRWSSGGGLSKGGASQPRLPLGGQFSLRVFVCLIVIGNKQRSPGRDPDTKETEGGKLLEFKPIDDMKSFSSPVDSR